MIRNTEFLGYFEVNKVTSRSDDKNESESARVIKREMLWSSRGSIRSMKVT